MKIKKLGALLVSAALCVGMAAPAFAFEGEAAPVEQPVLPEVVEEDVVTVTDETSGALTPEGNLTPVDDYHADYSDGSGQQFITLVSKSGNTFYLVIDRNAKGQQTVHFMNLVDEADLLALMEEEDADAYTAEKEATAQAEQDRLKAEEEAKKATEEEEAVTVTDEETGALTPEGNLTLVDDYHTDYSDGSGQQFITLMSKSGASFYLVIDRNAKGQQTVHFMNLVDEADLLSLMEDEDAEAYTAEKEAAAQAAQERKQAEEDAKKAAEEAEASGSEQTGGNKVTKYAATFLGVLALVGLVAGGGIYTFMKQKQKKQAEKEALDPDANYTEDKGDFEIPVEDEPEETGEEDTESI